MQFFEVTPAYGRDYKTKAEVVAAWNDGKDFSGGYNLNFQLVNNESLAEHKPYTVLLRYKGNRSVTNLKVS